MLREPRFRWFWSAQIVSGIGWGIGSVALPLTAIATLGASPMDMGVLGAASQLPVLLFALHAGLWFDRLPRQPILVATNLGRGAPWYRTDRPVSARAALAVRPVGFRSSHAIGGQLTIGASARRN